MLNTYLQLLGFDGQPMPAALKVTAALNFYASGSFQGSTGDLCGVSQSAVHCWIKEVTDALYRRAGDYVHFRTDADSQAEMAVGFGAIAGFLQVQGVIDCTHVAIKTPKEQSAPYTNRKGFHLLNVQLACDHRKCFLQVCAHFPVPGAVAVHCPHSPSGWTLGDKGYPLLTWLLTPVRNPSSYAEGHYNACHSFIRTTSEQAINMLKMCFRCLNRSGGALQYAPDSVGRIVVVCCVLHITMRRGEALQDNEIPEQEISSDNENKESIQGQQQITGSSDGGPTW
ncbi:putative nuclease HARBI1 [Heterodontus francisci]|uniref:putative nuclease HARBI1 n=1 Tax=Heterodontus francisci TaxID=7792 RepID=UPI00355B97B4